MISPSMRPNAPKLSAGTTIIAKELWKRNGGVRTVRRGAWLLRLSCLGQLRHNSNASGPQYGKRLKKEGILGIYLNMDKGQLSFSLNGENMGVAFDNASLKKGPVYPAAALLHSAGCSIRGELPIPSIFK
ncbi:unnamed protein product [Sphagnum balticum]